MIGLVAPLLAACCLVEPAGARLPPVTALAFAPGGTALVAGSEQGVEVRSWPGLELARRIEAGFRQVHDLAFSPDGKRLAVAGGTPAEDGGIEVFDWPEGNRLCRAEGHSDIVYGVAWSDDGTLLAAAALDGTVTLRRAGDGTALDWLEGHSGGVKAIAFLPGGTLISGGLDQTLRVWDVSALMDRAGKDRARSDAGAKLRAPDELGAKLRTPSLAPATDGAPRVRARNDGDPDLRARSDAPPDHRARMVRALANHTAAVHDLAVRPGSGTDRPALPWLASVGGDRTVRLWQPTIGRMVRFVRLEDAVPLAVRWTADGGRIVVSCTDGRVRIIDADTVQVLAELAAIEGWAYSLAVHPGGQDAAVGGERGEVVRVRLPE